MTLQSRLLVKYLLRAATTKILSKLHNHWDVEVHTVGLVILAMKPLKKINTWMIFLLIAETPQIESWFYLTLRATNKCSSKNYSIYKILDIDIE